MRKRALILRLGTGFARSGAELPRRPSPRCNECSAESAPAPTGHTYFYDSPGRTPLFDASTPDRGPPTSIGLRAENDTVGPWPDGVSSRPQSGPAWTYNYDGRSAPLKHKNGCSGPIWTAADGLVTGPSVRSGASGAAETGTVVSKVGPTTGHGAERIAGAGATCGGLLAEDQILLVRGLGQLLTQADGATVRVLQNEAGRFDVVDDGGLITTFSNLSQKAVERLATR